MAEQSVRHPACQFRSDKPWLDLQYHEDGTIKKPDELENDMKDPPNDIDISNVLDRIHGSMIGMALGDALGAHVEFRPHEYMVANPVTTMKGGGTWGLKKGQFTDDTSMALCLANSLIARRKYVPYDQLVRYKWWHQVGYMSSTGSCFDIGAATRQSLVEFERRQKEFAKKYEIPVDEVDFLSDHQLLDKFDVNCSNEGVAGNGALMRLAPVPLFFYQHPNDAVEYSGLSGLITHGDQKAYDACRYYGALIVAAVQGETREQLLDKEFYSEHQEWFGGKPLHADILNIVHGSYQKDGYAAGIRGKGYIVSALEAALWAFWSDEGSFKTGVLATVNLGDDTDTTAAIYGQLAGAYYGIKNLPEKWAEQVYAKKFIACLSKWIAYESKKRLPGRLTTSTIPTVTVESPSKLDDTSPFEQDTNPSAQLQSTEKKRRDSESSKQNQTTSMKPTSMSEQFDNDKNDLRPRRYTVHNTFNLQPNPHEQGAHRPNSAEQRYPPPSSQQIYHLKDFDSSEDVYRWFLSLGSDYKTYAKAFRKRNIDGYWLLNYIDDKKLTDYGVENKDHRDTILNEINQLKLQCPVKFSAPQE